MLGPARQSSKVCSNDRTAPEPCSPCSKLYSSCSSLSSASSSTSTSSGSPRGRKRRALRGCEAGAASPCSPRLAAGAGRCCPLRPPAPRSGAALAPTARHKRRGASGRAGARALSAGPPAAARAASIAASTPANRPTVLRSSWGLRSPHAGGRSAAAPTRSCGTLRLATGQSISFPAAAIDGGMDQKHPSCQTILAALCWLDSAPTLQPMCAEAATQAPLLVDVPDVPLGQQAAGCQLPAAVPMPTAPASILLTCCAGHRSDGTYNSGAN